MSSYALTASGVTSSGGENKRGIAGEAIEAGELLYQDSADDNKLKKATCGGTEAQATVVGIALCSAASGQPVLYARGDVVVTGTPTPAFTNAGDVLVLSDTPGDPMDVGDLAATNYVTYVGWVLTATTLQLNIVNTGQQVTAIA